MRLRLLALGFVLGSVLLSTAISADGPGRIVIPLPVSPVLDGPAPPRLSPPLEEAARFSYNRLAFGDDREKLVVLPAAAALLTDDRCEQYRGNDPGAARERVRGAVRNELRIAGTYEGPTFFDVAKSTVNLPAWATRDPVGSRFKGTDLEAYKILRSKGIDKVTDTISKVVPGLSEFVGVTGMLGPKIDEMQSIVDRDHWQALAHAAARCQPETNGHPGSARDPAKGLNAIRWIIETASLKPNSLAKLVGTDEDRYGFGIVVEPLDEWAKGNPERQRQVDLFRTGQPGSAPPPRTLDEQAQTRPDRKRSIEAFRAGRKHDKKGDSPATKAKAGDDEAAWGARVLIGTLNQAHEADQRLAEQTREIAARTAETPEAAREKAAELEANIQERLKTSREYRQMAGLALNSLANLGLDPALVRDLSVVSDSGFQIADGIIMLTNVSNPMGWLSLLSGITNLLGGFGPDPNQLILEQLHEIRRELAEFRGEVRAQFTSLRGDVLSSAQRVLNRIEDLEFNLMREMGAVKAQAQFNEYRLGQVEGQIAALSHQILTRFAELHQKDLVTLLASRDLDPSEFQPLDSPGGRTELLMARYRDSTAVTFASAVHHAASRTMSGGDFEMPVAYGVAPPRLAAGGPASLLSLVQHPTAPWSNPNDFVDLARSAGLDPLPQPAAVAAIDRLNRPGLVPDRTRVVNPLAWALAAGAFLRLAEDCPTYFADSTGLKRGLAEIYRRGEEFNDMANRLSSPSDGGVFRALIESQIMAIDRLDGLIKSTANGVAKSLDGINPWLGLKQQVIPPGYPFVSWRGHSPEWQYGLRDRGCDGTNDGLGQTFEAKELQTLVDTGLVPRSFCLASLVPANVALSGRRSILGGEIELKVVDLELLDDYLVYRGARREGTGFLGTGPGRYHDISLFDGPVRVTFEVRYRERSGTYDYPILRKRLLTRKKFQYMHDSQEGYARLDENGIAFWRTWLPRMRNGNNTIEFTRKGINPSAFVREKENWEGLKADLLALRPDPKADAAEKGLLSADEVEKALEERLREEVFKVTDATFKDLHKGLSEPGEAIREIVGCQWTLFRFLQLALPEAARDPELRALLLGEGAAWGGTSVMDHFRSGSVLVAYKAATGEVGKPGSVPASATSPLVQTMRVQTSKLQAKLEEVLARRQGQGDAESFRHPVVEGTLIRILGTARRLKIDIEQELGASGVDVPEHWAVRSLRSLREGLDVKHGEVTR